MDIIIRFKCMTSYILLLLFLIPSSFCAMERSWRSLSIPSLQDSESLPSLHGSDSSNFEGLDFSDEISRDSAITPPAENSITKLDIATMIAELYEIPLEGIQEKIIMVPTLHRNSHLKLNLAALARNITKVQNILATESLWVPDTIVEALAVMREPYHMCLALQYNDSNTKPIIDLLVQKLPADQRKEYQEYYEDKKSKK